MGNLLERLPLLVAIACVWLSVHVYRHGLPKPHAALKIGSQLTVGLIPFLSGCVWLKHITKTVPEPYMDEVFHIPQAQVYCEGRYYDWDDKITTPPGLYLLSVMHLWGRTCSAENLRSMNLSIVSGIAAVSAACIMQLSQRSTPKESFHAFWTGMNIALFPVIFFFSGLYYTDPASTLAVLLAYLAHLYRIRQLSPTIAQSALTVFSGLLTLLMRQTNIFWVVVYMGGLEAVQAVKNLRPEPAIKPQLSTFLDEITYYAKRYAVGDIHDPPLDMTSPIVDVVLCIISLVVAGVCNIGSILKRIWPHIVVMVAFVGFVAWNGGVVLGDKSNHVATLHLAQMLYIWPLFVFFSIPLFIMPLLQQAQRLFTVFKSKVPTTPDEKKSTTSTSMVDYFARDHVVQAVLVLGAALTVATAIVRFSTIIHPFTLADNRHYMFYVFRYSILRAWWIRYALIPIYVACAWLCWIALQGRYDQNAGEKGGSRPTDVQQQRYICSPWSDNNSFRRGNNAPSTSTVLILVVATTLSLMTAPLVEPRYFIMPWVFWRLLVPSWNYPSTTEAEPSDKQGKSSKSTEEYQEGKHWSLLGDIQFPLEMVWHIVINIATMYIFLTRPFYWKAPDGSLADGGRVQRFMW